MCGKDEIFKRLTYERQHVNEKYEEFEARKPLTGCKTFEEVLNKKSVISQITRLMLTEARGQMLLPPELEQFTGLKVLSCYGTSQPLISPAVIKCKELTELEFTNNQLTTVPAYLSKCEKLKTLKLWHNNLKELPLEFNECKTLQYITLIDNPLTEEFESKCKTLFPNVTMDLRYKDSEDDFDPYD